MVLRELIPEARKETGSTWRPITVAVAAALVLGVLQVLLRG